MGTEASVGDLASSDPDLTVSLPDSLGELEASMRAMMRLQDKLNREIHPQWHLQGFRFRRAAWIECAELADAIGWKWWADQGGPDLNQIRLELVDIWHFLLSDMMASARDADGRVDVPRAAAHWTAHLWMRGPRRTPRAHDRRRRLDVLDSLAGMLASNDVHHAIPVFVRLALDVGDMPWDDLHRLYVGKNALNRFRQEQGYKEGRYSTTWPDGREDNDHLAEVLQIRDDGDITRDGYEELVRTDLRARLITLEKSAAPKRAQGL